MNEQRTSIVDILNRLYAAEMHTLLPRLGDLSISASRRNPRQAVVLRQLAQESKEHREWLIEAIESNRGSVLPVSMDIQSAALHYVSASAVLPQLERNLEQLLAEYAEASRHRWLDSATLDIFSRISRRYEASLDQVRQSAGQLQQSS